MSYQPPQLSGGWQAQASPTAWERDYRNKLTRGLGRGGHGAARDGGGRIVLDSLVIGVVAAVLAAIVWNLVSPDVMVEVTENGVRFGLAEARREFGIEVAFAAVAAVAGLIAGAVLMLRHRDDPVAAQVAAAVTGTLAALAMWQLGLRVLGPGDLAERAGEAEPGTLLEAPLDVASYAVFAIWPIAAVVGGAVMIAVRDRPAEPSAGE